MPCDPPITLPCVILSITRRSMEVVLIEGYVLEARTTPSEYYDIPLQGPATQDVGKGRGRVEVVLDYYFQWVTAGGFVWLIYAINPICFGLQMLSRALSLLRV